MKYKFILSVFASVVFSVSAMAQGQKIMTLAGTGITGFSGDGYSASGANFNGPTEVVLDNAMNLYILDYNNYRIRKVNTAGIVTTVAGNGIPGNTGNCTLGTTAEIAAISIAVDRRNNLYFTDQSNAIIRKVNALGIISHVAGTGAMGYFGDGVSATLAKFKQPQGIAVDDTGNIFIADAGNHVIRRIDTFGKITTIAGTPGSAGYFGDGGLAIYAQLDSPWAVKVDHRGNIYINDFKNNVIRKIDTAHVITTFAGTVGVYGNSGDLGLASLASLNMPRGLGIDTFNNLYIADALNNVIRKVDTFGIISTVAGNGWFGFGGDYGYALGANFKNPYGVAVDVYGSIYIADANNQRVRKTFSTDGVERIAVSNGVAAYPNPFSGQVVVTGVEKTDKVEMYDVLGRLVNGTWEAGADNRRSFTTSGISSGIYLLKVSGEFGGLKATLKIVKE